MHGAHAMPGHPPPQNSQFYGSYGQHMAQNVFSVNASQALGYGGNELQMLFQQKM